MAQIQTTYVDIPELSETFVDSVGFSFFDGQPCRIDLCVTRLDEPKPPKPPTGRKYPVARLVLTGPGLVELYNHLNNLVGAMEQKGIIKRDKDKIGTIQ